MSEKVIPKPDFLEQKDWDNLIATRDAKIIAAVAKLHVQKYIEAKGEGETFLTQGAPTCLVTSIGRKTGNEVVSPVNFKLEGDDVYIVGSIAGLDKHPNWALNLDAKREGWVQIKANKYPVRVHRLIDEEREAVWPRLVEFFPLWGHFQKYCDRDFMVFRLSPAKE
ncbi:MAG: nitroreductase family deazaflavin-dependent oxidoreductase [bacterium]|nr:nitroreductase family deazaflavin-dependent oxidoreductase [bacterium]MCP5066597.1 nitroreductase family deazaflavin-dependent oxidoreductase [bacterium]